MYISICLYIYYIYIHIYLMHTLSKHILYAMYTFLQGSDIIPSEIEMSH